MATKLEIAKAKIEAKEKELNAKREQLAALEKMVNDRKAETDRTMRERKKYIIGEYVMQQFESQEDEKFIGDMLARLDGYLKRNSERRRFGFNELPKKQQAAEPPEPELLQPAFQEAAQPEPVANPRQNEFAYLTERGDHDQIV